MKRKSFTKKQREEISKKTNNKCGYCGEELKYGWHVDHMEAFIGRFYSGKSEEHDNFMASCPQCNNYKRFDTIEQFRKKLEDQNRLAKNQSVNYRFALKFKQILETPSAVIFYFETLNEEKKTILNIGEWENCKHGVWIACHCNECIKEQNSFPWETIHVKEKDV